MPEMQFARNPPIGGMQQIRRSHQIYPPAEFSSGDDFVYAILFTLTLALSRQGRGNYWTYYETAISVSSSFPIQRSMFGVRCSMFIFFSPSWVKINKPQDGA
jgi:hypothetical protein